jgi:TolB protein
VSNKTPNPQDLQGHAPSASTKGINLAKNAANVESLPDFNKYNKDGIGAIIIGYFDYDQAGDLELRLRMWDVLDERQLFGKYYTASKDNYRKMANAISDEIFKAITGEKAGYFNAKIIYVSEGGPANKRLKKISMIDFDGENYRALTTSRDLVLTPIFSKKSDEIIFVRYFENHPQIFTLNLNNLRTQRLGGFNITNFAPSTHPRNSNNVLLSAISDGNSDIYELDIAADSAVKLTNNPAIDTTPSYSPDGKLIAFTSDRVNQQQQIYLMDTNGSSVRKVSQGEGSYSKPMWSPDGKMLAFTRIKGGQFFIGIMEIEGAREKLLTSGYLVEGARWSSGGRHLIFSKKKGKFGAGSIPRLYIIDVVTGFEYEIPTPEGEGAIDPDWVM